MPQMNTLPAVMKIVSACPNGHQIEFQFNTADLIGHPERAKAHTTCAKCGAQCAVSRDGQNVLLAKVNASLT